MFFVLGFIVHREQKTLLRTVVLRKALVDTRATGCKTQQLRASLNFLSAFRVRLWSPSSLLLSGHQGPFPGRGLKLTTHLHLVVRSTTMELYLHSTIRLHSVELK
jgi:hypothetical protein